MWAFLFNVCSKYILYMTNIVDEDYIPPTPTYGFDKIQFHNIGWVSTVGRIVNADLDKIEAAIGGSISSDYETLTNKPKINSIELIGNKSLEDLGIQYSFAAGNGIVINSESKEISVGVDGTTVYFDDNGKLKSKTSFGNIEGNPSDNEALSAEFALKADAVAESLPYSIGRDENGVFIRY